MVNERRQWLDGDLFCRQEELTFRDCDARGRARPASLLSLMASAAGQDYTARGLGYERLFELRQVFLLSRISFRLHRYPLAGETVTVTTWENGVHGAHMRRDYQFLSEDGTPCLSAQSEWILVDPEDRRILRPSAFTGKPLTEHDRGIDCPPCRKILLPKEGTESLGEHRVVFSDLDHNGHVFSGNYGDIVWNALPPELQNARLLDFQINYSKEATLGERLTLLGCRDGDEVLVEGLWGRERSFSCACRFAGTSGDGQI